MYLFFPQLQRRFNLSRNLACSGSMDGSVRIWNLQTVLPLPDGKALVGLLDFSSLASRFWGRRRDTALLKSYIMHSGSSDTLAQLRVSSTMNSKPECLVDWMEVSIYGIFAMAQLLIGISWQILPAFGKLSFKLKAGASTWIDASVLDVWDSNG